MSVHGDLPLSTLKDDQSGAGGEQNHHFGAAVAGWFDVVLVTSHAASTVKTTYQKGKSAFLLQPFYIARVFAVLISCVFLHTSAWGTGIRWWYFEADIIGQTSTHGGFTLHSMTSCISREGGRGKSLPSSFCITTPMESIPLALDPFRVASTVAFSFVVLASIFGAISICSMVHLQQKLHQIQHQHQPQQEATPPAPSQQQQQTSTTTPPPPLHRLRHEQRLRRILDCVLHPLTDFALQFMAFACSLIAWSSYLGILNQQFFSDSSSSSSSSSSAIPTPYQQARTPSIWILTVVIPSTCGFTTGLGLCVTASMLLLLFLPWKALSNAVGAMITRMGGGKKRVTTTTTTTSRPLAGSVASLTAAASVVGNPNRPYTTTTTTTTTTAAHGVVGNRNTGSSSSSSSSYAATTGLGTTMTTTTTTTPSSSKIRERASSYTTSSSSSLPTTPISGHKQKAIEVLSEMVKETGLGISVIVQEQQQQLDQVVGVVPPRAPAENKGSDSTLSDAPSSNNKHRYMSAAPSRVTIGIDGKITFA